MLDDVTVTGADKVQDGLQDMIDRCDLRRFYSGPVASLWHQRQKVVFAERLAPLSPETVRIWKKTTPLIQTGKLRDATTRYTPIKADRDTATFGIPKGNPHKWLGTMHAQRVGSRPKRDAVPNWSRAEKLKIIDMLVDWIAKGKGRA